MHKFDKPNHENRKTDHNTVGISLFNDTVISHAVRFMIFVGGWLYHIELKPPMKLLFLPPLNPEEKKLMLYDRTHESIIFNCNWFDGVSGVIQLHIVSSTHFLYPSVEH